MAGPLIDLQDSDWREYRRMILSALERLEGQMSILSAKIDMHDDIRSKEISDLRVEVGMLKTKVAIYGIAASVLVTAAINILGPYLRPH